MQHSPNILGKNLALDEESTSMNHQLYNCKKKPIKLDSKSTANILKAGHSNQMTSFLQTWSLLNQECHLISQIFNLSDTKLQNKDNDMYRSLQQS